MICTATSKKCLEADMTDEEQKRMEYLERVEKTARAAFSAFNESHDYDVWDAALDRLEAVLKERP
jgi:hypothetical protein